MTRHKLGPTIDKEGIHFSLFSHSAHKVELCLFSADGEKEIERVQMGEGTDHIWRLSTKAKQGTRYGYRVTGEYAPEKGLWHDPSKLLVDPYASELDRPFAYDSALSTYGVDTAHLVPKTIVTQYKPTPKKKPQFQAGGLIYEVNVRAFTMLHPDIAASERGTIKALAHPAILNHLTKLNVSAIELMPITAWIDERHLPPLDLKNSWGYNPVALMALDPRLCPGGLQELADTVSTLHEHGIGTLLDLVFNHTGESDEKGPTLSMRGIDSLAYYSHPHSHPGGLINDTGTGNTLACHHKPVHDLVLDTLRHFVNFAGVDGFRFDLAPIMGRGLHGFSPDAPLLRDIVHDPLLADRILIAEPWDIGPGGYQLGNFPCAFLEWNDRARDVSRMFWRGDMHKVGDLATVLSGSSDIFARPNTLGTRTVNFIAAHDGFTLADLVAHEHKHNEANGEENRDGHGENYSWNNGIEGATDDPDIRVVRRRDIKALLATLFMSRGAIMLTAGDEMGRSQGGNNNAYAQDNALSWVDWRNADQEILAYARVLSSLRGRFAIFSSLQFLTEEDVEWLNAEGEPMQAKDWEQPDQGFLFMVLRSPDRKTGENVELAVAINRQETDQSVQLPGGAHRWEPLISKDMIVPARSVSFYMSKDNY